MANQRHLERFLEGSMEQVVAYHTDFQQADLREVPRLLVMHMMREPGVEFAGIIWDGIEAKGEEEDGIS